MKIIQVCNHVSRERELFRIAIGSPPTFDDAVIPEKWEVFLEFTEITLFPGECRPMAVFVRNADAVHLDQAIIPLTLLQRQEVPAGGVVLTFNIDNVEPPAPCEFHATVELPLKGDTFPGEKAVVISWNDDFSDQLGFPERVERWRIYNGAAADFELVPANLLIETCIDEHLAAEFYQHFADVPSDPAKKWYKIVAVDRAGNVSAACTTELQIITSLPPPPPFRRGDADGNGTTALTDAIVILSCLFLGTPCPPCTNAMDADDNGSVSLTDGIVILSYLFLGTPPPPPPGPNNCGPDTTPDGLDCKTYTSC